MNSNKNKITPSKGGMAFDIILAPDTNNKKRRPNQLPALESRHTKRKEITKQELEAKQKAAMERRKVSCIVCPYDCILYTTTACCFI